MQEKSARLRSRVTSAWALGAWLMVGALACSARAPGGGGWGLAGGGAPALAAPPPRRRG